MNFEGIADFVLNDSEVPDSALAMAALLLIDTLGVAAGASRMDAGQIARDHAARFFLAASNLDAAPMIFDGRKTSIPGAAFAAATQIDNLDAHDGYNPTKGHIGCAVVPALVSFAFQQRDLGARDALKALAISYEVSACAGIALHSTVDDYHTSGAWNALGVAALGCRLRNNSRDILRHALGIAEYHGPRSQMMREIANPTMLHDGSGMGALAGTMAVLLAEDGFEGAPAITVVGPDAAQYWNGLRSEWTIEKNYIKPYPICRWAHAAIDALGLLQQKHSFVASDVARIEVQTFDQAAALYSGIPASTSQAQYSLAFALAARLVHGCIGPEHIQNTGLTDGRVADLESRIEVQADDRHSSRFPESRWSAVIVELNDGSVLESGDVHARGGPESPMTTEEIRDKFLTMTAGMAHERQLAIWEMKDRLLDYNTKFSELLSLISEPLEMANV